MFKKWKECFRGAIGSRYDVVDKENDLKMSTVIARGMGVLREKLSCSICLDVYKEPCTLYCGHSFCKNCLNEVFEDNNRNCPLCRSDNAGYELQKSFVIENVVQVCENMFVEEVEESVLFEIEYNETVSEYQFDMEFHRYTISIFSITEHGVMSAKSLADENFLKVLCGVAALPNIDLTFKEKPIYFLANKLAQEEGSLIVGFSVDLARHDSSQRWKVRYYCSCSSAGSRECANRCKRLTHEWINIMKGYDHRNDEGLYVSEQWVIGTRLFGTGFPAPVYYMYRAVSFGKVKGNVRVDVKKGNLNITIFPRGTPSTGLELYSIQICKNYLYLWPITVNIKVLYL